MADKILYISKDDIDESGTVITDFSNWSNDIIVGQIPFSMFKKFIDAEKIVSGSEVSIFYGLHCSQLKAKNVHVRGNFYCDSDVKVKDLLIDGECRVNGNVECDNLSVFGPLNVSGNLRSRGNINFYSLISIRGKNNYAFGKKLSSHTPMIAIDRVVTDPGDQFGGSGRMIAIFFKKGEPMIELLTPRFENVSISHFDKEFENGFPSISKYIHSVDDQLRGAV